MLYARRIINLKIAIIILVSFALGLITSSLILLNYFEYDLLSTYPDGKYELTTNIEISSQGKTLILPAGLEVRLKNLYREEATVSTEFIVNIIELDNVSKKKSSIDYWYFNN